MAKKTCACLVVVLMLIFAGMICAELSQAAAWQTSITATGQTVGSAVKVSTVIIGEAETAVTHPAPPTPVEYTTYTYLTDLAKTPKYYDDIRLAGGTTALVWVIAVDPHGNVGDEEAEATSTISWDKTTLGPGAYEIRSGASTTGAIVVADMKTTTSFNVTGLATPKKYYTIIYTPSSGPAPAPPVVVVTDPAGAKTVNTSTYEIKGTVTDGGSGIGGVEVKVGASGTWTAATVTGTNWSYTATLAAGANAIQVRGKDNSATPVYSNPVDVPVLTYEAPGVPPVVVVTDPAGAKTVNTSTYEIKGTVTDGGSGIGGVEVKVGASGTWTAATVTGTNWSYTATLAAGANAIQVRGKDNSATPVYSNPVDVPVLTYALPEWKVNGTFNYSGPDTGKLFVSLFKSSDTTFSNPIGMQKYDWTTGKTNQAYSLSAVDGTYYVAAYIGPDSATWNPGTRPVYVNWTPIVVAGTDVSGKDIATYKIEGTISYTNTQVGTLYVGAYKDPNFSGFISGYSTAWSSGTTSKTYTIYVANGTYHLAAFIDTNGNQVPEPADPQGSYAGNPVTVSGGDLADKNITLVDSMKYQLLTANPQNPSGRAGANFTFDVYYTTSDPVPNKTTSGLTFKMKYDAKKLTYVDATNVETASIVKSPPFEPYDDVAPYKYVQIGWIDQTYQWPNKDLPLRLFTARFMASPGMADGETTQVTFELVENDFHYLFHGETVTFKVQSYNLDVDANAKVQAYRDGLLMIRYILGFQDTDLTDGLIGPDATRKEPEAIKAYLDGSGMMMDADNNDKLQAYRDGLLIIRYILGFQDTDLTDGLIGPDAKRTTPEAIKAYLDQYNVNLNP